MFTEDVTKKMDSGRWWQCMAEKSKHGNGPKYEFCIHMANITTLPHSVHQVKRNMEQNVWSKIVAGDNKAIMAFKVNANTK